jgi:sarcosine oxidase
MTYDAVVLGLGGMGSAVLAHLAKRGANVVGLEQFVPKHELGASAGRSRIIRKAYFEDARYVPLLERAYELWGELETESGNKLVEFTGVLLVGPAESDVIRGSIESAALHGLPVERWTATEIVAKFPQTRPLDDEIGVFEREAGFVYPEAAVEAQLAVAAAHGATCRYAVEVMGWRREAGGLLRVRGSDGTDFLTEKLALCAGPWLERLPIVPLRVQRNVQIWFAPETDEFALGKFPPFLVDRAGFPGHIYGFPDCGEGVKAALHGYGATTHAGSLDRIIHDEDVAAVRAALSAWIPAAAGAFRFGKACMYARTPDDNFVVDRHPDDERIVIAGGFSGHGFKFAPVIGEIAADLLLDGATRHDIGFLSLGRFGAKDEPQGGALRGGDDVRS